ncbi:MAG: hypothetical protein PHC38_07905 [Weeksellaceae bacterium]|nr:hypothetical protein [Weeksellaceae bacterium]
MNLILSEIVTVLHNEYPKGYGSAFIGQNSFPEVRNEISVEHFRNQINKNLPILFYEFYEWALDVNFPVVDITTLTHIEEHQNKMETLHAILDETKMWNEQIHEEWNSGFVALCRWDSAYQMVIDTDGYISNQKGSIAYWDFKGGSGYYLEYANFETFLKTKLELLKQNLYFPPPISNSNIDESYKEYEDFCYGKTSEKIRVIKERVNGKTNFISF